MLQSPSVQFIHVDTALFYEGDLLEEGVPTLGADRRLVVARERTKRFEEVPRGTTATLLETFQERAIRGEFTLVMAGSPT